MEFEYLKDDFMPTPVKNILLAFSEYSENRFNEVAVEFEKEALGVINANISLSELSKDTEYGTPLIRGLCTNYVTAKLHEMIAHPDYIDLAADLMVTFRDNLKRIKDSKNEAEEKRLENKVASLIIR